MKAFRRVLVALGLVAAIAYVGALVWLVTQESRLVFRAGAKLGEARPAPPWEQIADLPAWIVPARSTGADLWILYLHGNSSDIASQPNIQHYERLRELGVNVLAPEYRGFGGVGGVPTEAGLGEDARRAYAYLQEVRHVDARRIVI